MREKYEDDFEAGMGAEAIKKLLEEIDLRTALRSSSKTRPREPRSGQKQACTCLKRLEVVEAFRTLRQPARSG